MKHSVRLADQPSDYQRFGLDPKVIQPFEDGQRIEPAPGAYEWWYFDAHLDDGAKLVVVFYTKPLMAASAAFAPMITINMDLPDGRSVQKRRSIDPSDARIAKDRCSVVLAGNRFEGDLQRYKIAATIEDVAVDIDLVRELPSWRPHTGHTLFTHNGRENLLAWLPSVPQGRVSATYRIGTEHHSSEGVGYHDHNWGNVPIARAIHNWYWGRAKIGPYTVIASYVTAAEKYGYETLTRFMLARDGKIISSNDGSVDFAMSGVSTDAVTGKPFADKIQFTYTSETDIFKVAFQRKKTILQARFLGRLPWWKRALAKIARKNPAYLRFTGPVTITHLRRGQQVDSHEEEGLWELMYFGNPR